jgi:hypothetical protein
MHENISRDNIAIDPSREEGFIAEQKKDERISKLERDMIRLENSLASYIRDANALDQMNLTRVEILRNWVELNNKHVDMVSKISMCCFGIVFVTQIINIAIRIWW